MPSADAEFLGLAPTGDPGRYRFTVTNHLARFDGHLYGGTAIAVCIAAAELVSQRPAVWMTTQFVSTAPPGAEVMVHAEVLAPGRRTNQVRVTGTDDGGQVMFASVGATGHHRGEVSATFEAAPRVSRPETCEPDAEPLEVIVSDAAMDVELPHIPRGIGFGAIVEFRAPEVLSHPDPGPGRVCLWVRRRDAQAITPVVAAFMADMVPISIAHGTGRLAGGISLDNTIRIGAFEPTEWILLDLRAHLVAGDYGHGAAYVWSERGSLLAAASQSASMFDFDPDRLMPRRQRPGS